MLSWLLVKLNTPRSRLWVALACSVIIHSMGIVLLIACGRYTAIKHTVLLEKKPVNPTDTAGFARVRLGALPVLKNSTSKKTVALTQTIQPTIQQANTQQAQDTVQEAQSTVTQVIPVTATSGQTTSTLHPDKQADKQAEKPVDKRVLAKSQDKPSTVQTVTRNKKALPKKTVAKKTVTKNKKQAQQESAPGSFSVYKRVSSPLMRTHKKKELEVLLAPAAPVAPVDKLETVKQETIPEQLAAQTGKQDRLAREHVQKHESQENRLPSQSISDTTQSNASSTVSASACSTESSAEASKACQTVVPCQSFADPKQIAAYKAVIQKIHRGYGKPPGFGDCPLFSITFEVAYATGKPQNISPRPEHVPLLVYQPAKASVLEVVYPQELWGTELEIPFN